MQASETRQLDNSEDFVIVKNLQTERSTSFVQFDEMMKKEVDVMETVSSSNSNSNVSWMQLMNVKDDAVTSFKRRVSAYIRLRQAQSYRGKLSEFDKVAIQNIT